MFTNEDLVNLVYDPIGMQSKLIDEVEQGIDHGVIINDPSNPFIFLMESNIAQTTNAMHESIANLRKIYPTLAVTKENLFHHLSDAEYINLFSIPATTKLTFLLNIQELKTLAHRINGNDFSRTIIPEYTAITVANTTFTLLNNIVITLYDDGRVFVEQEISSSTIGIQDLGVLNSYIQTDNTGHKWVGFETSVKQVRKISVEENVTTGMGFNKKINIDDKLYYVEIFHKLNDAWVAIKTTYSNIVLDPNVPTAELKYMDEFLTISIPNSYLINGLIGSRIRVDVYTTKGKLSLPLKKYASTDFSVTLGKTTLNAEAATSTNLTMHVLSTSNVDGGANEDSMETIRDNIIFNTAGTVATPITEKELKRVASNLGFDLFKTLDVVTDRIFIASKNLPPLSDDYIRARADMFINTSTNILADLTQNPYVDILAESFIIKSNSVFKEENSIVTLLTPAEQTILANANTTELLDLLNTSKYFYTPFHYILDKIDDAIDSRIYNMDDPEPTSLRILSKNSSSPIRVNTVGYSVVKTDAGYIITLAISGNSDFNAINPVNVKAQMNVVVANSNSLLYIDGVYDSVNKQFTFTIDTNFYVDTSDFLTVTNGISDLATKRIELDDTFNFIFYSDSALIPNFAYSVTNELRLDVMTNVQALAKESLSIKLGYKLDFLWNKVSAGFTERKYLKWDVDVPLYYDKTVYAIDPTTNNIFTGVDTNADGLCDVIEYVILHNAGDPVLDEFSNPIYKHRIGDVKLDVNDAPIIDQVSGVVRYIDIFMLEYEFKVANNESYQAYLRDVKDNLLTWLQEDITDINGDTLERTSVLFKPFKTTRSVRTVINNSVTQLPYYVIPNISIYVTEDKKFTEDDMVRLKRVIGRVLHEQLENNKIVLSTIKQEIISVLEFDVAGVKVTGLDNGANLETFSLENDSNRLTVDKQLELNINGSLVTSYNIQINIEKI